MSEGICRAGGVGTLLLKIDRLDDGLVRERKLHCSGRVVVPSESFGLHEVVGFLVDQSPSDDLLELTDGFHDGVARGEAVPETDETGFWVDVGVENGLGNIRFDGNRREECWEVKMDVMRVLKFNSFWVAN